MPPLIGLVLLGAGVVAGYRAFQMATSHFRGEGHGASGETREAAAPPDQSGSMKDLGALEFDPESGVYRPRSS